MTEVLFVCLGNICRSPLMQGVAEARWRAQTTQSIGFDSAGIGAWHVGAPPDSRAVACAQRHGIDISGQRARQVSIGDFHRFDLILCADHGNLDALRRRAPSGARAECALLLDWSGVQADGEISDPYGGDERAFEAVYALIDLAGTELVQRLRRRA
jgi:protein-tyrosine phosphatase